VFYCLQGRLPSVYVIILGIYICLCTTTLVLTTAETNTAQVATLRKEEGPTVILERSLCFYYSDFYEGNFIFTEPGDICYRL
jgi:hypothetical protein